MPHLHHHHHHHHHHHRHHRRHQSAAAAAGSSSNTSDSGDDSGGSSPTPHDHGHHEHREHHEDDTTSPPSSPSSSPSSPSSPTSASPFFVPGGTAPASASHSCTPQHFSCLAGACSVTDDRGLEKEYILVNCNNSSCDEGDRMHYDCFAQFEDAVLKFMRKTGRARSWSEEQRRSNLWTDKGYGLVKKVCKCRCGRGFLRPELASVVQAGSPGTAQRKAGGRRSRGKGKGRASASAAVGGGGGRGGGGPPPLHLSEAAAAAASAVREDGGVAFGGGRPAGAPAFPQAVGSGSPVGSWSSSAHHKQHQHQHQHDPFQHPHPHPHPHDPFQRPHQHQHSSHQRHDHRRDSAPAPGGTAPLWGDGGGSAVFADPVAAPQARAVRAVLPFNDLAPGLAPAPPDWVISRSETNPIHAAGDGGDAEGDVMMHHTNLQDTSWLEEARDPPQRRWSTPGFFADGHGAGHAAADDAAPFRMQSADPWGTGSRQDADTVAGGGWASSAGGGSGSTSPARHWGQATAETAQQQQQQAVEPHQRWSGTVSGWLQQDHHVGDGVRLVV